MASFKLGCIKGEKGDSGAKGEKGDTGLKGDSGTIPVFEIDKVETVDSAFGADVEIDSSSPENPKLTFRIPKGADGKDASGNMIAELYDTEGKKTDIYKYADELFEKALPKTGGRVSGTLSVGESPEAELCVRNITFTSSLPEKAADGDICFVVAENYENTIYDNGVGSILLITEGDEEQEYIVAAKDYHKEGCVSLIRKRLLNYTEYYNYKIKDSYYCSDIDNLLESVFVRLFPYSIQKLMIAPILNTYYKRHCFLPSATELTEMEYFKNNSIVAKTDSGAYRDYYMTRELNDRKTVPSVNSQGEMTSVAQNVKSSIRPMIVLPGSLLVENAVHDGTAVIKPAASGGVYYYSGGGWKEFML